MGAASARTISHVRVRETNNVAEHSGFSPWILRICIAVLCMVSALALTAQRIEITRLSYGINELYQNRQNLLVDVTALETEAQMLGSSARIRKQAEELGLVFPDSSSFVELNE